MDDELAELAPIEPHQRFIRRAGETNWFDPHSNALWIETSLDRINNHEMNHLLAHVSTPYGFFLQTLADLQTKVAIEYFQQTWDHTPQTRVYAPVLRFAQSMSPESAQGEVLRPFVGKCVKPWSWLVFLERVFEGEDLPSAKEAKRGKAVAALNLFEDIMCERGGAAGFFDEARLATAALARRPLVHLTCPPDDEELPACFQGTWFDGRVLPLGAAHVMETLAQQAQADFREPGAITREPNFFLKDGAELYWFLFLHAAKLFGLKKMHTKEGYRRLYNTVIALTDLALFCPAGPIYGRLRNLNSTWESVNPAMRYLAGLHATSSVGWIDDMEKQIQPFQEAICQIYDWPKPEDCLRLGMSIKAELPAWQRHREACQLRLQKPAAFLMIERTEFYNEFFDKHMPLLYHPNFGEVVVRASVEGESLGVVVNYFLVQWCWHMMNHGIPDYHSLLPPRLRFETLLYEDIHAPEDFLRVLLRDNAWIHADRFQVWG